MPPEKLSSMANQIAAFFRSYPDDEAEAGIARHLTAFWTPAMLDTFRDYIAAGAAGVDDLVLRALRPPVGTGGSPADRAAAPARHGGPMATDAG